MENLFFSKLSSKYITTKPELYRVKIITQKIMKNYFDIEVHPRLTNHFPPVPGHPCLLAKGAGEEAGPPGSGGS